MEEYKLDKALENYKKYSKIGYIRGNQTEDFDRYGKEAEINEINKNIREKLSFVNKGSINYSGIESDSLKNRIEENEEKEYQNRIYIANNYRGFGYKKNLEDFESTMFSILTASISVVNADKEQKEQLVIDMQNKLKSLFLDKTLSNSEVKEEIQKIFKIVKEEQGIDLTNNIAKCAYILIDKYRLSLYNLKESDLTTEYKENRIKAHENNLRLLNQEIREINSIIPIQDQFSLRDVMISLNGKNRDKLEVSFVDGIIKKLDLDNPENEVGYKDKMLSKISNMQIYASKADILAKEVSTLNKYERLSSIALNYMLAEKNGVEANDKKINHKILSSEFLGALKISFNKTDKEVMSDKDKRNLLKKVANNINNENRLNNYAKRVHDRLSVDTKLNFSFTEDEIKDAIKECARMFESYANKNNDLTNEDTIVFKKLNTIIENKITNFNGKNQEADVLETISNTLKDNLYNKLIRKEYGNNKDTTKEFEVDIIKNLDENKYDFDEKKNENILSCDNMQKIFKMIQDKTISSTEALAIVDNNKDLLKGFTSQERFAVTDLIEDISNIKKQEALLKKDKKFQDYLFEDLKKLDDDYDARMSVAEELKRKHISHILNDGKLSKSSFSNGLSILTSTNGPAIIELMQCAEKKVETRKMDTGLSMASQCLETYRQKTASAIKEVESNLSKNLSNPMIAMSGMSLFIVFLYAMQKGRLTMENYELLKNEEEISRVINHIESVNEQKIKDGLAILYKLKGNDSPRAKPESFTIEKELLIEAKKDLFFSELLITGKDEIKTKDGYKALDEISYTKNNAADNFKDILKGTDNKEIISNIIKEIRIKESNLLENKKYKYNIEESDYYSETFKYKEKELKKINIDLEEAKKTYQNIYNKIMPELKNDLENARDIFNPDNINEIKDESTQKELRNMLKNINDIKHTMKTFKTELIEISSKMDTLKKERESISPFMDILNEDKSDLDSRKLNDAIKTNPDKIISMFNNLESLNSNVYFTVNQETGKDEIKNEFLEKYQEDKYNLVKKRLIFNIIDRSANENNSDLLTSDFFREIATKILPHNKNLFENLSDYNFDSQEHSQSDKIILNISYKNKEKGIVDSLKDVLSSADKSLTEILEEKLDGRTPQEAIVDAIKRRPQEENNINDDLNIYHH